MSQPVSQSQSAFTLHTMVLCTVSGTRACWQCQSQRPISKIALPGVHTRLSPPQQRRVHPVVLRSAERESDAQKGPDSTRHREVGHHNDEDPNEKLLQAESTAEEEQTLGVRFMLGLVIIYKQGISPFLPGSCRYVPTCSSFAKQAFEEHGVARGCLLTAWRILRCNPIPYLGGSGYDPVKWPPPGLGGHRSD